MLLTYRRNDGISDGILRFRKGDTVMPLTKTSLNNAETRIKPYKLSDFNGLYVLVNKSGKYFRFDYRLPNGKRKTLSLGVYPKVSIEKAREKCNQARKLLKEGIDPSEHKKQMQEAKEGLEGDCFEMVAREWYSRQSHIWAESHLRIVITRLEQNIFPWLGQKSIKSITAPDLLKVLRRIEERGSFEVAHRIKQVCGAIFRYGIATGKCDRDPAADLKGALTPVKPKHMAAITKPAEVAGLLRAIDSYHGHFVVKCALRLAPLLFVRPGELRHAEWSEIDFEHNQWRIPAQKMKMREEHIVPLVRQSMEILKELYPMTGRNKYVFSGLRGNDRAMSENAVLAALRRMGYAKEEMTGHGFRAMASTILHEQGWPSEIIERQLAHAERNKVRAAYNHAEHLDKRREMMEAWADYLDKLRDGEPPGPPTAQVGN